MFYSFQGVVLQSPEDKEILLHVQNFECLSTFFNEGELDYSYAAVTIDLVTGNKIGQNEDVQNGGLFKCPVCRFIVKGVRTVCEEPSTRALIESAITHVCSPIPFGTFRRICDDTVRRYFSQFVNLILNTDDRKICRLIKLCESQSADTQDEFLIDNSTYIIPFEEDVKIGECLLCKAIVKAVKEIVKHSFKRDQVKRALSKVCKKVHSKRCQSFLNKHFNQLVDLISNGATRGRVCRVLMVCSSDTSAETYSDDFDQIDYNLRDFDIIPSHEENVEIGECLVCKAIVKAVKEIVKHSFTKDQVKRALSKVCKKVHSKRCQSFLNKHFNQLVDLISNGATRWRVCRVLMVCSSDTSAETYSDDFDQIDYNLPDFDIITYHEENVEIGECLVCKAIVKAVKEIVKHSFTKDQVQNALSDVCRKVHSNKCQSFLNQYFNRLVHLISNAATKGRVCSILIVCLSDIPSESDISDLVETDQSISNYEGISAPDVLSNSQLHDFEFDDVEKKKEDCGICKAVVATAKAIIKTAYTKDQIKDALGKVCGKLHRFGFKCQHFVNMYADTLIDLLQNAATRNRVCTLLKLGSAEEPATLFLEHMPQQRMDEHVEDFSSPGLTDVDKKKRDCAICKAVVATAKAIIKTSYNRDQIKDALRKVCGKLHRFGSKCQNFVNKYSGNLIDLLQNAATRNRVCSLLKLCSAEELTPLFLDSGLSEDIKPDDDDLSSSELTDVDKKKRDCAICKAVVATAKAIIKTSYNRDQIKDALRKVCGKLHRFGSKCQNFVNKYSDNLIDLLQNAATRNRVCSLLKLCSAEEFTPLFLDSALSEDIKQDDDDLSSSELTDVDKKKRDCAICKAVVATAKAIIKTSHNRDQIKDALRKVCGKLHRFGSKCQNFVNKYSDNLIDLLQNAATRNRVCSLLKLCSAEEFTPLLLESALSDDVKQDDDDFSSSEVTDVVKKKRDCTICKAVVATAKAIVKTSYNREQIKDALRKVCGKLHRFGSKCQNFVNKYSDKLIDLLQNAATRNRVCSLLKLCSAEEFTPLFLDSALSEDIKQDDDDFSSSELTEVDKKKRDCAICKAVVATAKAIIKTSYNRDQIKDALRKVCGKLHRFGSKCQNFVNKYSDKLIDLLQNAATRNRVCSLLKLCSAEEFTPLFLDYALSEEVKQDDDDEGRVTVTCDNHLNVNHGRPAASKVLVARSGRCRKNLSRGLKKPIKITGHEGSSSSSTSSCYFSL